MCRLVDRNWPSPGAASVGGILAGSLDRFRIFGGGAPRPRAHSDEIGTTTGDTGKAALTIGGRNPVEKISYQTEGQTRGATTVATDP